MADYANNYKTEIAKYLNGRTGQLLQLLQITWDGDLVNKTERDFLLKLKLCQKCGNGWNIITPKGITALEELGFIHP